ncbi:guanine deaminase [Oxalobacteraceae bacterium CAVE-383]|nr:guanine deaminase [Oxalobacteraceae bacterium CAVE-383]
MNFSPVPDLQAYRAAILYFAGDPTHEADAVRWHEDGLLLVENGLVRAAGDFEQLFDSLPEGLAIEDMRGKIIMPGFIDTHVHYPQTDIIGSPADGLLPWLNNYTFPAERHFDDLAYSAEVADFFLKELLRNGTTTAAVYCTVHPESVDAFFTRSAARNLRMIAGKCLMDRNAPPYLMDSAEQGVLDSEQLLQRWHGNGRQSYAITVRFAPTSTPLQMQLAGELAARYPDAFIQTHVAENQAEVAWVKSLYPDSRSYLDVYDRYGLLRKRALYAHCIWLDDADRLRMAQTGAAATICPTSNLFLGSGMFDFRAADAARMPMALATDVGGGTSFSMLQTMNEGYKAACMNGVHLSGARMFYMATLGGARALQMEDKIGSFRDGCEADFIVLDPQATPLLARRSASCATLEERLFALAIMGDDRAVAATYSAGKCVHNR